MKSDANYFSRGSETKPPSNGFTTLTYPIGRTRLGINGNCNGAYA